MSTSPVVVDLEGARYVFDAPPPPDQVQYSVLLYCGHCGEVWARVDTGGSWCGMSHSCPKHGPTPLSWLRRDLSHYMKFAPEGLLVFDFLAWCEAGPRGGNFRLPTRQR